MLLAAAIALIEIVLSLADAGIVADPSLRRRVFVAGAFWASLLHGDAPLYAAQPMTMFVSHAFLHGSLLHMAMNLTILLALGRFTADRYGPGAVLPVFLLAAIAGGAAFGLLSADRLPMVGASGAVFAFLGVWIAWDWRRHRAAGASDRAGGAAGAGARLPQRRCSGSALAGGARLAGAPRRLPRRPRLRRLVREPDRPRRNRRPRPAAPPAAGAAGRVRSLRAIAFRA